MQADNQRERGEGSPECEVLPPPAQDGEREPEKDDGEPAHERHCVEAQLGQAAGVLIELHAEHRRREYHGQENNLHSGLGGEQALGTGILGVLEAVQTEEERQDERGDPDQFKEAGAGVLGVGQPRRGRDRCRATEEVAKLD